MAPPQGYGATAKKKRSSATHMETKQDLRPEENPTRSGSGRSTSWDEWRNKKGSAPSRRGDVSLDIPFYRTCPVSAFTRTLRLVGPCPTFQHKIACEVLPQGRSNCQKRPKSGGGHIWKHHYCTECVWRLLP